MQASCEITVEVMLDDEPFRVLSIVVPSERFFCWLKGALDATIDSCRPHVSCKEAIEAITKHFRKVFIFAVLSVCGTDRFSSRAIIIFACG